jgi:hypothetical protein
MKLKQLFTDFSAGEIGSRLGGRIDTGILQKGAKEITNMIIQEDGGATKRTGTKKIVPTLDYDDDTGEWAGRRSRIISTVISGNQPYLVEFSHLKARLANADDTFSFPEGDPPPDIFLTRAYTSCVEGYAGYVPSGQNIKESFANHSIFDATHLWFTGLEIRNNSLRSRRDLVMFRIDGAAANGTDLYEIDFSDEPDGTWVRDNSLIVGGANRTPVLKRLRQYTSSEINSIYTRSEYQLGGYEQTHPNTFQFGEVIGNINPGFYILAKIPASLNISSKTTVYIRLRNATKNTSFKVFSWTKSVTSSTTIHPTIRVGNVTPQFIVRSSWGEWGFIALRQTDPYANDPFAPRGPTLLILNELSFGISTQDVTVDVATSGTIEEFTTPYSETEIFDLKYTQINKSIIITHPNHPVKEIVLNITTPFKDFAISNLPTGLNGGTGQYPSSCTFFQGRLYLAGTLNDPNRVWASKAADPNDFAFVANEPSSSFFFTLNSQRSNRILWMEGRSELILGTASAEWRITGTNGLVTATTVFATRQTTFGSSGIQGRLINDAIFFVQRDNRRLREYIFSNESQAYNSLDVTVYSPHIAQSSVVDVAFSQDPDNIIYEVLGNGDMAICTYNKAKQVMAWSRIQTDGNFESIAIVAGVANEDDIWAVVNRDGRRHIERFSFRSEFSAAEPVYLDSHITIFNPPTTTVAGLNHLEGKEVYYLVDGEYFPPKTVENGEIELDSLGSTVHIGLPFTARITTNRLDSQVGIGVLKRVVKVKARVYKTIGLKAGPSAEEQMFRIADEQAFRRVEPREEDVEIYYPGGFDKDGYVELIHDYPLPFTLLALQIDYEASEV